MKYKKIYVVIRFVLCTTCIVAFLLSCEDNEKRINCNDPNTELINFSIQEYITDYTRDTLISSDTVLTFNKIIFTAEQEYLSYEWHIGEDPRIFKTRKVELLFEDQATQIKVKLIAKHTTKNGCSLSEVKTDTITKHLTVVNRNENPIFGKYRGSTNELPDDIFTVEVRNDISFSKVNLINLNKGCYPIDESLNLRGFNTGMGYKCLLFTSSFYHNRCLNPKGILILGPDGKRIKIVYSIGNGSPLQSETKRINEIFNGQKL